MTKQHFEFVASLICAAHKGVAPQHLATLAAAKFTEDNPRFDEKRFRDACGVDKPLRVYGKENHSLNSVL